MPIPLKYARKTAGLEPSFLLSRMRHDEWRTKEENLRTIKDINGAAEEVDRLGDFGLTVAFKEIRILNDNDAFLSGGTGEIYVVASTLDGSGESSEFKTQLFEGIDDGDKLPLGDGGMLLCYRKNPRWFIDLHVVVMESDGDLRSLGESIEKAREAAKLNEVQSILGALAVFDPTKITLAVQAVGLFLDVLVHLLTRNGDDHVATIHDFYLKHQAFGQGSHPPGGKPRRYQDVEATYEIELTKL